LDIEFIEEDIKKYRFGNQSSLNSNKKDSFYSAIVENNKSLILYQNQSVSLNSMLSQNGSFAKTIN